MKTTRKSKNLKHGFLKLLINSLVILLLFVIALLTYRDSLLDILKGITEVSPSNITVSVLLSVLFFIMEGSIIYKMASGIVPTYRLKYGIATAYRCEFYRLITFGSGTGIAEIHYLHKKGIEPDSEVEYQYDETNPDADNQLEAALEEIRKKLDQ